MRSSDWSSDVCSSDLLLESHRVKELARRSLEGAGHAKDGLDLASLLKDIRGELWAGREDKFAARMRDQYLQLLTDLKGVLGKESDDAAKTEVDLILRELDLTEGAAMRGSWVWNRSEERGEGKEGGGTCS